jgi:hypothetical protein
MRLAWPVVLCVAACAGAGPVGSDAALEASAGQVTLAVGAVASPSVINRTPPSTGRFFVTLALTLTNVSVPTPVPASLVSYRLATTSGLTLTPSPVSGALAMPCPGDVSVNAGAQYQCAVAFEVPTGDAPATLQYNDTLGHTASAAVPWDPAAATDRCPDVYAWLNGSNTACQSCVTMGEQAGGPCGAQDSAFRASCRTTAQQCASTCQGMTDPAAFCGCIEQCYGASCTTSFRALDSCLATACGSSCQ